MEPVLPKEATTQDGLSAEESAFHVDELMPGALNMRLALGHLYSWRQSCFLPCAALAFRIGTDTP